MEIGAYLTIRAALTRAFTLAPALADARAVRGALRFRYGWDWLGRTSDSEAAIEDAHRLRSANLCFLGIDMQSKRLPTTAVTRAVLARIHLESPSR